MAEGKHTRGPWIVVPYSRSGPKIEVKNGDHRIECPGTGGAMSYTCRICEMWWSGTDEWKANAHLIAAAPDMLGALVQVRARFSDRNLGPDEQATLERVNAAISKAKGQTP